MATPIPLEVVTFDGKTQEQEKSCTIDYANPRDRAWFAKHQTWALNNGRGIAARPIGA